LTIANSNSKKKIRNFRIRDSVWQNAKQKADDLGITMTFLVEKLLQEFNQKPRLVIGEPEIMEVPDNMKSELSNLAEIVDDTVKKISKK